MFFCFVNLKNDEKDRNRNFKITKMVPISVGFDGQ